MGEVLRLYRAEPLPSILDVPVRDVSHCLELLRRYFNRTNLAEDLDPEAERQLCQLVEKETGVPAVFILGFPLTARPFYTASGGTGGRC